MLACRRVVCCLGVLVLILHSAGVQAADWPQWGKCGNRNGISDEKDLPDSFVPGKKKPSGGGIDLETTENVKWAVQLGTFAYGNPTVAGGRLFVGTDDITLSDDPRMNRTKGGLIKCLDQSSGELIWQLATPKREKLPAETHFSHQFLGICSSPTVDGNRLYVVTSADELICLDVEGMANGNDGPFQDEAQYMVGPGKPPIELNAADGDVIWRFDIIDDAGVVPHDAASCSALVHGDLVYVGTSLGVDQPHTSMLTPDAPALIVLDKHTGRLVATDNEKIGHRMYHAQWAPPSLGKVGDKTLIFFGGGDGICYAFEALSEIPQEPVHLKKVWSYDCNPREYKYRDGKPIPYYDGDKRKRRGNNDDGTYVGPSQIIATPVFHNNRIYVPIGQDPAHGRGRGMMHCIDATKTGDVTQTGKIWTFDQVERSLSTVSIADGLVYLPDVSGKLHCLDADTGHRYWVHDGDAETWGTVLVADGKLYFGTKKGFYVFAAGKELKPLSETPLGSSVFTMPIAVNGTIYVTSQRYLWAVSKKP